jgi:hypothetical protein
MHRVADVLADPTRSLAEDPQVTSGLAAAEGRAVRQEVKRRPDHKLLRGPTARLDFIDAEPKAGARQAANIGDCSLDETFQFVLRSLPGHFTEPPSLDSQWNGDVTFAH